LKEGFPKDGSVKMSNNYSNDYDGHLDTIIRLLDIMATSISEINNNIERLTQIFSESRKRSFPGDCDPGAAQPFLPKD
jgi:hypothetical protein